MKKFLMMAAVAAMVLSGCSTPSKLVSYTRTTEPAVAPMMANVRVDNKKVSGTFEWFGKKKDIVNEQELIANAVFAALKKVNADVLVAPQYQVSTEYRGSSKSVTVTAIGYPGFYEDFRPQPEAATVEATALNDQSNYLISTKDNEGKVTGYQVVLTPKCRQHGRVMKADQTETGEVTMSAGACCARPNPASTSMDCPKVDQPKGGHKTPAGKLFKKTGKKSGK